MLYIYIINYINNLYYKRYFSVTIVINIDNDVST